MKLSLNGLVGYLQGKGWKVRLNEDAKSEEETFEILEEEVPPVEDSDDTSDPTMVSEEELVSLKALAGALAKNGKLVEVIQNGELDKILETVPAAAALVQNAREEQKVEKDALVASIKTNGSNIYTDEELSSLPIPVLRKLDAQMNVSFAGLGGAVVYQNEEAPLTLPSSALTQPQEANNGS